MLRKKMLHQIVASLILGSGVSVSQAAIYSSVGPTIRVDNIQLLTNDARLSTVITANDSKSLLSGKRSPEHTALSH